MYDETFKDALYGAFQPADEEYDPSFLVRLLEYFPTDKVDVGSGTYDQYLYDLEKTVVDNYEKGNYQVSFFYAHLIFMSYTYYCVDHAFQTNPDRMKDLFYPINAYNGKTDKPDIENHASVYDFSKIPEKEIFKVFRALEMEDEKIKALPLDKVTLFFVNEIEAAQILGQKELESTQEAAAAFRSMFPQAAVVLTLGSQGSVYIDKDQVIPQKCYKVKAVDTTAAGDTFTGFFVSAISKGKSPKEALDLASRASAIAVSRPGAAPSVPTLDEVENWEFAE